MERVVTINLNGNPFQLEEPAYDALRAYIGRAEAALVDNPDQAEIVHDLEQAIADKCAAYLSPSKSVVSAAEMARILDEMGPVNGEAEAGAEAPRAESTAPPHARKRLYRIKDGAQIAGVCGGLGAYFDLDVNWIRFLFLVAAVFTSGAFALVYIAMMFLIPSAHTSEEWAAAHGVPFNAQEVIDRAKREYARMADDMSHDWRSSWRAQRRAFREQMRAWRWRRWDHGGGPAAAPAQPVGYVTRVFAGLFAFIFSIVTAALLIAFLLAFFTFLGSGQILGWEPPGDVPSWLVLVVLAITYAAISAPFSALRRASYATVSGYRYGHHGADGFVTMVIVAIMLWFAWAYLPEARAFLEQGVAVIRDFAQHVRTQLN
jgi:phage shock protein PspC (stress-responsive transcriptional regulator)